MIMNKLVLKCNTNSIEDIKLKYVYMTTKGCSSMVDSAQMSSSLIASSSSGSGGVERGKGYEQAAVLAMWWNHARHVDKVYEGKLVCYIE